VHHHQLPIPRGTLLDETLRMLLANLKALTFPSLSVGVSRRVATARVAPSRLVA
jgi:ABC-type transport system involved in cytochrome c biogenesis ATPase subunit